MKQIKYLNVLQKELDRIETLLKLSFIFVYTNSKFKIQHYSFMLIKYAFINPSNSPSNTGCTLPTS